ncbi:hypothetical protein BC938DRAFT_479905 [Jimgerdemannia flammicorona]|uniref:Sm domain-containing protein n=1 Tax=Jimgerdemannia flammicorona TaxID=994334 RepID=A0A433QJV2_9FUNG|nr:hypothetical protein BC938DRAFT_479905 [Jimgerdemannia flammicorona]
MLLVSRQGKVRLTKWFQTIPPKEKGKIVKDVTQLVLARRTKMCNFLEYKGMYSAGLATLQGGTFARVVLAYFIMDELLIAGEIQETSKKSVLRVITQQDQYEETEATGRERENREVACVWMRSYDISGVRELCTFSSSLEQIHVMCHEQVTVELKNDLAITGVLISVDQFLNIKLDEIKVVDEARYPHMIPVKNCFIRGSVVRYVQLPAQAVDTALLQDAARREAQQPTTAQQGNVRVK